MFPHLLLVSAHIGKVLLRIKLNSRVVKRFYLLLISFLGFFFLYFFFAMVDDKKSSMFK